MNNAEQEKKCGNCKHKFLHRPVDNFPDDDTTYGYCLVETELLHDKDSDFSIKDVNNWSENHICTYDKWEMEKTEELQRC